MKLTRWPKWLCPEVVIGLALLLLSRVLLLWSEMPVPRVQWVIGLVLFWSGVAILVFGLFRDCRSAACSLRARGRHGEEGNGQ